jgi:hypothetical protein
MERACRHMTEIKQVFVLAPGKRVHEGVRNSPLWEPSFESNIDRRASHVADIRARLDKHIRQPGLPSIAG